MSRRKRNVATIGDSQHATTLCPHCGELLEAATGVAIADHIKTPRPKPGDLAQCAYCAGWLRFDADLRPVKAEPDFVAGRLADLPPELRELYEKLRRDKPFAPLASKTGRVS